VSEQKKLKPEKKPEPEQKPEKNEHHIHRKRSKTTMEK
jgi:hypothetical protein